MDDQEILARTGGELNRPLAPYVSQVMTVRIFAALALVVAFLTVGGVGTAFACSCADRTPQERMRDADAVFTATAASVRVDEKMLDGGQVTAALHADHVYKGASSREIEVVTQAQSAACGFDFVVGRRYLIFARSAEAGLTTTLCSGNRDVPAGDRPLRPSAQTDGFAPLEPELITALGTPRRPDPTQRPDDAPTATATQRPESTPTATVRPDSTPAVALRPDNTPAGEQGSGGTAALVGLVVVAVVLMTGLGWTIRRFRRAG